MKIILEAFGRKLRSDVQEWPENTSPKVKLPLPVDSFHFHYSMLDIISNNPRMKIGTFQWNGHWAQVGSFAEGDAEFAKIYVLTDLS
jgi:hypothetical protein